MLFFSEFGPRKEFVRASNWNRQTTKPVEKNSFNKIYTDQYFPSAKSQLDQALLAKNFKQTVTKDDSINNVMKEILKEKNNLNTFSSSQNQIDEIIANKLSQGETDQAPFVEILEPHMLTGPVEHGAQNETVIEGEQIIVERKCFVLELLEGIADFTKGIVKVKKILSKISKVVNFYIPIF